MRMLTLRGWLVAVAVGALSALVMFLLLVQIRHWLTDEAQLHQIVELIQQGRIQVVPVALPSRDRPMPTLTVNVVACTTHSPVKS